MMNMNATMMHLPLSVQLIMEHGASVFPTSRVGTFDGVSVSWVSYSDIAANA